MSSIDSFKINACRRWYDGILRGRQHWLIYLALISLYAWIKITDVLVVSGIVPLVFPLNAQYFSKLLFSGFGLNPDMAHTVIAPANAIFIYPPGIYLIGSALGTVRNFFIFLFVIQALVPLLIFRMCKTFSSNMAAIVVALFSIYYLTNAQSWLPDTIIQPFMMIIVCLIFPHAGMKINIKRLIIIGILTGFIIILKHNIGVFWAITCGTIIYWSSFEQKTKANADDYLARFLLLGYFLFGLLFFSKLNHISDIIFYLLPYFLFWMLAYLWIKRNQTIYFDKRYFFKATALYAISALMIPMLMFIWIGGVIGYGRYWYALFGMGFDYIHVWEYSIFYHVKNGSLARVMMMIGPFLVNLVVVILLLRHSWERKTPGKIDEQRLFSIASLVIMAIFTMFPLEDYHNALPKMFIFLLVLFYFLKQFSSKAFIVAVCFIAIIVIPALRHGLSNPFGIARMDISYGSDEMRAKINIGIKKSLADELSKQLSVINRSTQGNPYYVIDQSGGTFTGLISMIDNKILQYYIRSDKEMLNKNVVNAHIAELNKIPFVVAEADGYDHNQPVSGHNQFNNILWSFIKHNFMEVDRFTATAEHLYSFVVLKKKD